MKIAKLTKIIFAALIVLLSGSLFFNVRNTIQAQRQKGTFKELLEKYQGKEVKISSARELDVIIKEVNSDYLVFEYESDKYFLPFHSIIYCSEGKEESLYIDLRGVVGVVNSSYKPLYVKPAR